MIIIALGSSLGDGEAYFAKAEKILSKKGVEILKKSKNYKTKPYGGVAKNEFTNAVWQIDTDLEPMALLSLLQETENACGRTRNQKWEDRTLDLDILVYNDEKWDTEKLKLPHSEIKKRDFVLAPWAEITKKDEIIPHVGNIHALLADLEDKN